MLGLMCMPMSASTPSAAYTPTSKSMKTVWLWLMSSKNKGIVPFNVSKQHKTLINLIDSWYRPLPLATELEVLKSSADEGACLRSVDNIDRLVAQQLQVCERACVRARVRACVIACE